MRIEMQSFPLLPSILLQDGTFLVEQFDMSVLDRFPPLSKIPQRML
jgi:hypothetical protein